MLCCLVISIAVWSCVIIRLCQEEQIKITSFTSLHQFTAAFSNIECKVPAKINLNRCFWFFFSFNVDPRKKYHIKLLAYNSVGDGYQADQTISTPGCVCEFRDKRQRIVSQ